MMRLLEISRGLPSGAFRLGSWMFLYNAPIPAVMSIVAELAGIAFFIENPEKRFKSGMITMPPPMPSKPEHRPVNPPIMMFTDPESFGASSVFGFDSAGESCR
jgi:hypothetical protein